MSCLLSAVSRRLLIPTTSLAGAAAPLSTTPVRWRQQAGKHKPTKYRNKPLTYDQAWKPWHIGVAKSWLSWHSGDLEETRDKSYSRAAKFMLEDMIIRKFMVGTWHACLPFEVVIKRNGNLLRICGYVNNRLPPRKIYWLTGYTEELLSRMLKQPVRLELQVVADNNDAVYIRI